jgi:hypothetical protein
MIMSDADSQTMEPDDDMQDPHSKIILELCPDADPGAITKSYIISPGALNKVTTNDLGETSHTYTAQATQPTEILLILGRTPLQQARSQPLFIPDFLQSWPDTEHEDNSLLLLLYTADHNHYQRPTVHGSQDPNMKQSHAATPHGHR